MRAWCLAAVVWLSVTGAGVTGQPGHPLGLVEGEPKAPPSIAETGLYEGGRVGVIASDLLPFSPQYPLWSDGAVKTRWMRLPAGSAIDVTNEADWEFPVGTKFWKEFRFGGRRVETRFLWRASADRWVAGTYLWNADETEAVLAPAEGVKGAADLGSGRRHTVPGLGDCWACHGTRRVEPLGVNALQLSTDRDPNALHGEPLSGGMVTNDTLQRAGHFLPARPAFVSSPPRIRAATPETRAVVGYLTTNCGSCHRSGRDIVAFGTSLKHADVRDGDAVLAALAAHRTDWQVPGVEPGASRAVDAGSAGTSAIVRRMASRRPSTQMPPLGTAVVDSSAVAAVTALVDRMGLLPHLP